MSSSSELAPEVYETAVYAAKKGLSVTLFEQRKAGGTCLHEGCIPTKCLCRSAEIADTIAIAIHGDSWFLIPMIVSNVSWNGKQKLSPN